MTRTAVVRRRVGFGTIAAFVLAISAATLAAQQGFVPGANVNMVKAPNDPYLQRQIEGAIAVGTRNPCHLMGAGIDYRLTVDPGVPTETLDGNLQRSEEHTSELQS